MFVFRKIWHTLFSRNTRFEIRSLALLLAMCFHQKLESIQRNTCLVITGAIEGTSYTSFTKFTKVSNTFLN